MSNDCDNSCIWNIHYNKNAGRCCIHTPCHVPCCKSNSCPSNAHIHNLQSWPLWAPMAQPYNNSYTHFVLGFVHSIVGQVPFRQWPSVGILRGLERYLAAHWGKFGSYLRMWYGCMSCLGICYGYDFLMCERRRGVINGKLQFDRYRSLFESFAMLWSLMVRLFSMRIFSMETKSSSDLQSLLSSFSAAHIGLKSL